MVKNLIRSCLSYVTFAKKLENFNQAKIILFKINKFSDIFLNTSCQRTVNLIIEIKIVLANFFMEHKK